MLKIFEVIGGFVCIYVSEKDNLKRNYALNREPAELLICYML